MSTKLSSDAKPGSDANGEARTQFGTTVINSHSELEDRSSSDAFDSHVQTATKPASKPWLRSGLIALGIVTVTAVAYVLLIAAGSSREPATDLTHPIARGDLVVTIVEQGTLESSNNTEIKCKIRGNSTVTWVIEGGTVVQPGDELVRMDTKRIEESIGTHSTDAFVAKATFERTKADVERAEIAIDAYLEGTYLSELKSLEKQLALAISNHETSQKLLVHSEAMFRRGYVSKYEVQSKRFSVKQTELELKVRQTAIDVLHNYTKKMELETLRGNLRSLQSKFEADKAGLAMDEGRRERAIQELEYCVVKAERSGLVIYPSAAAWKETPDIAEGANVRNDQVLLLMPDLTQMQIKVGIHEALIDRIKTGQPAKITLPDFSIDAQVETVATVARPAGWWTGNVVKYDTTIKLPVVEGLKPGMSAEVEVVLSEHKDVILVPVSAVVETEKQKLCWVQTADGVQRRVLELGDSNDVFIIAKSGLAEGDNVILNPLRYVEDAKGEALQMFDESIFNKSTIEESESVTGTQSDPSDR